MIPSVKLVISTCYSIGFWFFINTGQYSASFPLKPCSWTIRELRIQSIVGSHNKFIKVCIIGIRATFQSGFIYPLFISFVSLFFCLIYSSCSFSTLPNFLCFVSFLLLLVEGFTFSLAQVLGLLETTLKLGLTSKKKKLIPSSCLFLPSKVKTIPTLTLHGKEKLTLC